MKKKISKILAFMLCINLIPSNSNTVNAIEVQNNLLSDITIKGNSAEISILDYGYEGETTLVNDTSDYYEYKITENDSTYTVKYYKNHDIVSLDGNNYTLETFNEALSVQNDLIFNNTHKLRHSDISLDNIMDNEEFKDKVVNIPSTEKENICIDHEHDNLETTNNNERHYNPGNSFNSYVSGGVISKAFIVSITASGLSLIASALTFGSTSFANVIVTNLVAQLGSSILGHLYSGYYRQSIARSTVCPFYHKERRRIYMDSSLRYPLMDGYTYGTYYSNNPDLCYY